MTCAYSNEILWKKKTRKTVWLDVGWKYCPMCGEVLEDNKK